MTYEYACTACGHEWEAEQSISEAPLTECPHCHASAAKRMVSGGQGFILKGGGWYADGYGNKKAEAPAPAAKDAKPADAKADPAKPAAAPAATTETAAAEAPAAKVEPKADKPAPSTT